jgi:hypothetical protein
MHEQPVLPLESGWPAPVQIVPAPDESRFHPRSLAPGELDEAGCFSYAAAPSVFLGRKGFGPLRIAWDTNVLIDWRDFGSTLLTDDEALPAGLDPVYEEELVALGGLMNTMYTTRDVRVYPLQRQLRDLGRSRRGRSYCRRLEERARQLDEVASALWCVGLVGEFRRGRGESSASWWQADCMKPSPDRLLVEEAIKSGCHVFLTRDKKVLKQALMLKALGLAVMTPSALLDTMLDSEDMSAVYGADGILCDNHKLIHLERAAAEGAAAP